MDIVNDVNKALDLLKKCQNIANSSQAELNYINGVLKQVEINIKNLAFTIDDSVAINNYAKTLENIKNEFTFTKNVVNIKMNSALFLTKLGKVGDVLGKVGKKVTKINIVSNGIKSILEARKEYGNFTTNLEIMQQNIYILDAICAQTDDPLLFRAASNMRYNVQTSMNDLLSKVSLVTDKYGNAVISIELDVLHNLVLSETPFGPTRTIGNVFLHTDKIAETITKSVAAAEISDVLSNHFINSLKSGNASDGNGSANKWVAYYDYSANMYTYLINLAVIRRNSEQYVIKNADEINLSKDMVIDCKATIDNCNNIITEYFPKLVVFNKLKATTNKTP